MGEGVLLKVTAAQLPRLKDLGNTVPDPHCPHWGLCSFPIEITEHRPLRGLAMWMGNAMGLPTLWPWAAAACNALELCEHVTSDNCPPQPECFYHQRSSEQGVPRLPPACGSTLPGNQAKRGPNPASTSWPIRQQGARFLRGAGAAVLRFWGVCFRALVARDKQRLKGAKLSRWQGASARPQRDFSSLPLRSIVPLNPWWIAWSWGVKQRLHANRKTKPRHTEEVRVIPPTSVTEAVLLSHAGTSLPMRGNESLFHACCLCKLTFGLPLTPLLLWPIHSLAAIYPNRWACVIYAI